MMNSYPKYVVSTTLNKATWNNRKGTPVACTDTENGLRIREHVYDKAY